MTPIRFHPDAVAELTEARHWYRDRSDVAAQALVLEQARLFDDISRAPETWPKVHGELRRYVLRRFPYSILYRMEQSAVVVTAVAHQRRRFGYWRDR